MIWIILIIVLAVIVAKSIRKRQYEKLEAEVLNTLGVNSWNFVPYFDTYVTVKSRQALGNYDEISSSKAIKNCLKRQKKLLDEKMKQQQR